MTSDATVTVPAKLLQCRVNPEDSLRHRFLLPGGWGVGSWLISKVSHLYLEAVAELLTVQLQFRVSKRI